MFVWIVFAQDFQSASEEDNVINPTPYMPEEVLMHIANSEWKVDPVVEEKLVAFYCKFLACHAPHGKALFEKSIRKNRISAIATVSTEAYAMFDRENHAKYYDGEFTKNDKNVDEDKGHGKYSRRDCKPRKNGGYTKAGLNRFVTLCGMVQSNRNLPQRQDWENFLLQRLQTEDEDNDIHTQNKRKQELEDIQNINMFDELVFPGEESQPATVTVVTNDIVTPQVIRSGTNAFQPITFSQQDQSIYKA